MIRKAMTMAAVGVLGILVTIAAPEAAQPANSQPTPTPTVPPGSHHRRTHHRRHRTVGTRYRIDVRQPAATTRAFASHGSARGFYHRLGRLHFQRNISRHGRAAWHVRFRSLSWHRYGRVHSAAAARRLTVRLVREGFQVRAVRVH